MYVCVCVHTLEKSNGNVPTCISVQHISLASVFLPSDISYLLSVTLAVFFRISGLFAV